jgi:hypothetical protein
LSVINSIGSRILRDSILIINSLLIDLGNFTAEFLIKSILL